jgi:transposase
MKLRQRISFGRVWRYLVLAVDGLAGVLKWTWMENMKGSSIAAATHTLQEAGVSVVVWDRAGGHRTREVREVGVSLVEQPAASPELNPAERVFEELRRKIEGTPYADIAAKVAAVEAELTKLTARPAAVCSLAGWNWIREARQAAPINTAVL